MDYLLLDEVPPQQPQQTVVHRIELTAIHYERVSQRKIGNLPLWHINIGYGRVAKGFFAVGLVSEGIVSVGLLSLGIVSLGVFGIGLLAFGAFALGLVAVGSIAAGILAIGAVAFGIFSLGACAIGQFAVGAAALGNYAALGDSARGAVALGFSEADGSLYQVIGKPASWDVEAVRVILDATVPKILSVFKNLFLMFLH